MRKSVLSFLLALCLVLTLLPTTALATPHFVLTVGNTDVSSLYEGNWDDTTVHYWKAAASGDDAYAETGSSNDYLFSVRLDWGGESFTLAPNGVNITTADSNGRGIYSNISLNIVFADISSNSVSSSGDAIYANQNVSISGSGSLTVTADTSCSGIYSPNSNIIIEGVY